MGHRAFNLIFGVFALCATVDGSQSTALNDQVHHEIVPETRTCEGAAFPEEFADATRAARAINKAFETYQIASLGQRAGRVAYMLFESDNFKNHYPGRPSQGTRMMAMPSFVRSYAERVAGSDAVAKAESAGGDAGLDAVLQLANCNDEKNFRIAAWFLNMQCTPSIRAGLDERGIGGWHDFLTRCVNTTVISTKKESWKSTLKIHSSTN
ncbi:LOW QUALITY PROTEIN: hypothetical protein J3E72DRAFT_399380 [Bipolaris maydis]|nr:LOW QUALITY PROTEIN: hypothetical protein J3E72DRAFT_399380 [Bipolaris maydis]